MLQVCLNGARTPDECCSLPVSPDQLAREAAAAVAAGAEDVHLHPKGVDGVDSLEPEPVARAVAAVRAAVPAGVKVGVTTGAWAVPDPERRAALIRSWTVLPDHASVNWHEEGAEVVAEVLLARGVGVEAGIYSSGGAAHRFRASGLSHRVLRVLAEVTDTDPVTAAATAVSLIDLLGPGLPVPILLHGEDGGAWPVLRVAARLGLDTRIGLEDTLVLPDGSTPEGNAALVRAAKTVLRPRGA
ncbi:MULTISPECIES: 3-keto-5-aminohexanoate cleavage protein [Streptacidiphilus]|uniref:3-keto-5-aminohexanoate cleavage protein n=1 Tax=Streptacidiphilus cavernicola TaxID=3342716 RepID=A0ABV6UPM2_9ACTN|nr:3-keto-5-aminohexanoate cleavage protein [Streptacidiphilus jeojiense]